MINQLLGEPYWEELPERIYQFCHDNNIRYDSKVIDRRFLKIIYSFIKKSFEINDEVREYIIKTGNYMPEASGEIDFEQLKQELIITLRIRCSSAELLPRFDEITSHAANLNNLEELFIYTKNIIFINIK